MRTTNHIELTYRLDGEKGKDMKKQVPTIELLSIINRMKQDGKSLDEIIKIMERKGLHRDNTIELYELLK